MGDLQNVESGIQNTWNNGGDLVAGVLSTSTPLGWAGLYHTISGLLTPKQADLQNPVAATASTDPSWAQSSQDQLANTVATEQQQAKSSSYLPFSQSESLDSSSQPMTSSRVLLGS